MARNQNENFFKMRTLWNSYNSNPMILHTEARDGSFNGCLWKDCPSSCCRKRTLTDSDGNERTFFTTASMSEWKSIKAACGDKVTMESADIPMNQVDFTVDTVRIMLISNCLWETWCKIADNKPTMCKFYPFGTEAIDGIDTRWCPAAVQIGLDSWNMRHILEMRKHAWLTDNALYIEQIYGVLSKLGHKPTWDFLDDAEYLENIGVKANS